MGRALDGKLPEAAVHAARKHDDALAADDEAWQQHEAARKELLRLRECDVFECAVQLLRVGLAAQSGRQHGGGPVVECRGERGLLVLQLGQRANVLYE